MPRGGNARTCNYCHKRVTCPCETLKNAKSCANYRTNYFNNFVYFFIIFLILIL